MTVRGITTSVAILHPRDTGILCVRHPAFDRWMFPGGHVAAGEAPHAAAGREVAEEVGLAVELVDMTDLPVWSLDGNIRLPQPLAMIEERLPHDEYGTYVDIVYVGLARSGLIRLEREVCEAAWFGPNDLPHLCTTYPIRELALAVLDRAGTLRRRGARP